MASSPLSFIIHNLDHLWFSHNLFQLPPPTPSPPFPSIELMKMPPQPSPANSTTAVHSSLPPARFHNIPSNRAVETESESAMERSTLCRRPKQLPDIHVQVSNRQLRLEEIAEHSPHETDRKLLTITEPTEPESYLGEAKCQEYQGTEKLRVPKFETISSGKQLRVGTVDTHDLEISRTRQRRRDRRKSSKSLTNLEFDELKGIKDLGFTFNKDDLTPRVVSVFPGLRRQLGGAADKINILTVTPLKYLPCPPETWWIRSPDSPLRNWRVPALDEEGVDMKEHLKFWARAVASAVRQEC